MTPTPAYDDSQARFYLGDVRGVSATSGLRTNGRTTWDVSTTGWRPTCGHEAPTVPATVLDPFIGSGTTAMVAKQLGRHAIGIDLSAEYLAMAAKRCAQLGLM